MRSSSWRAARLAGVAIAVGVATGVGASVLVWLLHVVQHAAFGFAAGTSFQEGVDLAASWRRVAAVLGAGLVAGAGWWLLRRAGRTAVDVPAAIRGDGRVPVPQAAAGAFLQIVTVGLGASLGREGAPRELGAAAASWLGDRGRLPAGDRRVLLAAGAGAGLAVVYDVPVSGALFALETLLLAAGLVDVAAVAVVVTVVAVATGVSLLLLPDRPTYAVPGMHDAPSLLAGALLLGPLAGVVAAGFSRVTARARRDAATGWHMVPGCLLGFGVLAAAGVARPELLGNGKGPAQLALTGALTLPIAALVLALKPLVTALCLRGGAVGGLITPAYATGCATGLLAGSAWTRLWGGEPALAYALLGGAAVLAGTMRAPLTAGALGLELTGGHLALLPPVLVAVTGAWLVCRALAPATTSGDRGQSGRKPRSRRLFVTTRTELAAIAAPASSGDSSPSAATGISTTL